MSPTKTKAPKERTEELEERLRLLEQQRQQAADAITLAKQRIEEIAARQQQIAVAVVAEDEEAAKENEELEEALVIETRRRTTARSAAEQLAVQIEQAREALTGERRREHLQRAECLACQRHALEQRAEEQMAALLGTLSELGALDARQRAQNAKAGREEAHAEHPLDRTLYEWLCARLGGAEGYLDLSISPGFEGLLLYEPDGLASRGGAGGLGVVATSGATFVTGGADAGAPTDTPSGAPATTDRDHASAVGDEGGGGL